MTVDGAVAPARVGVASASVVLRVLGSTIVVDAGRAERAARVAELLAPFVVDAADGPAPVLELDPRAGSVAQALAAVLAEVNARAIAGYRGLAVHAGVVARGDRAICFPAESGTGKSTITAACLRRGFDYVSDEALCLDLADGSVVPYPRPISLSPASIALLGSDAGPARVHDREPDLPYRPASSAAREVMVAPADLGARTVATDRRLRLTDVVELRRGAAETHLEPRHRSLAVPVLLSMAFNHFKAPAASVEVVGALAREVRVWRLHLGEPMEAAALLARSLS